VGELARRLVVAAFGIPLAVLLIYLGGWPLGVALAALAAVGASELCDLSQETGVRPFTGLAAALAAGVVVFTVNRLDWVAAGPWVAGAVILGSIVAGAAAIWLRGPGGRPLDAAGVTVYGGVLVGAGFASAMLLRNLDPATTGASWQGASLVAFPLTIIWTGDTTAYFFGTRWGRRKLIPSVSPKKSIEGAVAGLSGSVIAAVVFERLVFDAWFGLSVGTAAAALGGAIVGAVGQVGDLAESVVKRGAGVKDSGRIFPGHGGVLDRFDALIFAMPAAWVYFAVVLPRIVPGLPWR
jgi:phosphatidate cytidylyltransferase